MTTFTAKYLAPLNPGNKYLFDRAEAAKVNPVRRIPVDTYQPMPRLAGGHAKRLAEVDHTYDRSYNITKPFERTEDFHA